MRTLHNHLGDDEVPAAALLLADHLDAALAAAEDLEATPAAWPQPGTIDDISERRAAERRVIERVRAFEAVLIGRVLRARQRAHELAREEAIFASLARLFVGGTAPLADAVTELGDASHADFATGDCLVAYLRRRGVIDAEACGMPEGKALTIDADFLVAGRVPLGPLVDMIVALIDALEAEYDLYCEAEEDEAGEAAVAASVAPDAASSGEDREATGQHDDDGVATSERHVRELDAAPPPAGVRLS